MPDLDYYYIFSTHKIIHMNKINGIYPTSIISTATADADAVTSSTVTTTTTTTKFTNSHEYY